jgi:hypothetical protein
MTGDKLILLSGVALIAGGLLATVGYLLFARFDPAHQAYEEPFWLPFNFLIIGGGFFMALGLPGFYAAQARQSGVLGLVGFVIFFAGIVFAYLVVHSMETMTFPNVPRGMMLIVSFAAPSLLVGGLLTAVSIWRAGVYPPWLAVALVAAGLLGLLVQILPVPETFSRDMVTAVFTLVMAAAGISLLSLQAGAVQALR